MDAECVSNVSSPDVSGFSRANFSGYFPPGDLLPRQEIGIRLT